jgi:hypothetical protein
MPSLSARPLPPANTCLRCGSTRARNRLCQGHPHLAVQR